MKQFPLSLGLFGNGIAHSLSPLIHSYWFSRYGIEAHYHLYDIDPSLKFQVFKDLTEHLHGVNITIPYKEFVARQVLFERVGAVNTLYRLSDGKMEATNTDVLAGLSFFYSINKEDTVVILGNGGTARALVEVFFQLNLSSVHIIERHSKFWHKDYEKMLHFHDWQEAHSFIAQADYVINTVPHCPLEGNNLRSNTVLCDYTYGKSLSLLSHKAKQKGCEVIPGLEFLLKQAQYSFFYWFGFFPDITGELKRKCAQKNP